jgi:hypothetical protein
MTRILREYRRERAAHSMTVMCGALAFMAAVTWCVRSQDFYEKDKRDPGPSCRRMLYLSRGVKL